jgi:putative acetyltransferase
MPPAYQLIEADSTARYEAARALIEEYAAQIGKMGVNLCFQNLSEELDRLAFMYGPPTGCLLLATHDEEWVGCGALRRFSVEVCEMKRLYVKSSARGARLGRVLAEHLVARARTLGYRRIVLDTLKDMIEAQNLYRSLGFRQIAPYYSNPLTGVSFMELDLGTVQFSEHRS